MSARAVGMGPREAAIQVLVYLIASTFRHNAACTWNDILDRDLDRHVERSKTRPLASGAVSLTGAVLVFLGNYIPFLLLMSLVGPEGFKIGLFITFVFDIPYPLAKRLTYWPQAYLGLAVTGALPVSWVSIRGYTDLNALIVMYLGGVCWSIYYDTIYACQDRRDDVKAGVKSTAVLFGDYVRPIECVFAALFDASLVYAGLVTGAGPLYFAITVGGTAACFAWQMLTLDFDDSAQCWDAFRVNGGLVGLLVWGGMAADYYSALQM
ncbi:UbiA prenyltransferase [Trametes elegans]|nr:UbiA prenyltransferase [Trametes elegans]